MTTNTIPSPAGEVKISEAELFNAINNNAHSPLYDLGVNELSKRTAHLTDQIIQNAVDRALTKLSCPIDFFKRLKDISKSRTRDANVRKRNNDAARLKAEKEASQTAKELEKQRRVEDAELRREERQLQQWAKERRSQRRMELEGEERALNNFATALRGGKIKTSPKTKINPPKSDPVDKNPITQTPKKWAPTTKETRGKHPYLSGRISGLIRSIPPSPPPVGRTFMTGDDGFKSVTANVFNPDGNRFALKVIERPEEYLRLHDARQFDWQQKPGGTRPEHFPNIEDVREIVRNKNASKKRKAYIPES